MGFFCTQATEKKSGLDHALAMQSQYQRMLDEYAEYLETAQSKLQVDTISAKDLPHLEQQLAAHTAFFSDLESHRTLLDALQQKVDPSTKQRFLPSHTRLTNLTHVVQDKAGLQGQRLERLAAQWRAFQEQFNDMRTWLDRLDRQMPEPMQEDDPIDELRRKIWDFHSVQSALAEEKANMYQTVDRGRQLVQGVSCPTLDSDVTEFSEHWVQLNNDVDAELKRFVSSCS